MQLVVQRRVSQEGIKKLTDILPHFFHCEQCQSWEQEGRWTKGNNAYKQLPPRQGWSWWRVEALYKTRNPLMHRRLLSERSHAQGTNLKLAFSLVTSKRHMKSAGDKARSIIRHTEWYLIKYEKWMYKEMNNQNQGAIRVSKIQEQKSKVISWTDQVYCKTDKRRQLLRTASGCL